MARQRKSKNELDSILEQLKRSYSSEASDLLEDDLLESSDREDDAELNEILGKIFSSSEPSESDSKSQGADSSVEIANTVIDQDIYREFVSESEKNDDETDNTETVAEGSVENNAEHELIDDITAAPEEASSVKASEELMPEEETLDDPPTTIEVVSDVVSGSDISENEQTVEDILNIMFANKVQNASKGKDVILEMSKEEDVYNDESSCEANTEKSDFMESVEDISVVDGIEDAELIEEAQAPETADVFEDAEEVDEEDGDDCESFDFVDSGDDPLIDVDEDFAVEDEEYDVDEDEELIDERSDCDYLPESESETVVEPESVPSPKLVLLPEDYTQDPLQEMLPIIGSGEKNSSANVKASIPDVQHSTSDDKKSEAFDKNDISMLLNFGYGNEIKSKVGEKKTQEVLLENDRKFTADVYEKPFGFCGKELTERSQLGSIKAKYRSNLKTCIVMLSAISIISLLIMVLNLAFEFNPDRIASYPGLLTIEFTLVLITAVILYKKLISGVAGIFKFEMKSSSIFSFVVLLYGLSSLASLILYFITFNTIDPNRLMMFGFCVSIYAVLSVISDLLTCIKEYNMFKIIESSEELYVAERQKAFSPLSGRSGSRVKEDRVYKIRKTSLVSGYFRKTAQRVQSSVKPIYLIGVVPIISLVIGGICFFFGGSLMAAVSVTMFSAMLCLPFGYVFIPSFVEYMTSKWVSDKKIAFIGNNASEEMSKAELIILKDNDTVEITSYTEIRPSNRTDIKKSLDIAYELFRALGGPLSGIGSDDRSDDVKANHDMVINQITDHGIDVYFDSSMSILLGDKHYMQLHNIKVKTDGNLSTAVRGVDRSVLYMAFDGVPKLGFIVNSRVKPKFIRTANSLAEEGIRVFVETYEPQINSLYYEQNKGDCAASIGVIKPEIYEDSESVPMCDGCVVSGSDALNLAQAICMSKEIHKQKKIGGIINIVTSICGVAGACFLTALAVTGGNQIAFFEFLSNHITFLFGLTMFTGLIPGIVEIIRISKRKK